MKHQLSLHIPQTMDDWSLTIMDTSIYTDLIPVSCPTLQILLPGFKKAVTLDQNSSPVLVPGFTKNLSACMLNVQKESCGSRFDPLPDGVYVIKYSVSPNDYVYVEYNHLRIVKAMTKWDRLWCELELAPCANPKDKTDKADKLMEIRGYLYAAVATVQGCHNASKGMELYEYAIRLMDKMTCSNC
jgi:hypothetical protein